MEKEKVLEIEFKEVWDNKWAWKIIKNEVDFKNTGGEIPFNNIKITCANKEDLYVFDNWLVEWGLIDDYSLIDSNLKADIQDFINYINEKYGRKGYIRLWIPNSPNAKKLEVIRELISRQSELRKIFDELYNELFKQSEQKHIQ